MVNLFSGATLDFAAINRASYSPFDICHRAYAQEPNASSEASEKHRVQGGQLHKAVSDIYRSLCHRGSSLLETGWSIFLEFRRVISRPSRRPFPIAPVGLSTMRTGVLLLSGLRTS